MYAKTHRDEILGTRKNIYNTTNLFSLVNEYTGIALVTSCIILSVIFLGARNKDVENINRRFEENQIITVETRDTLRNLSVKLEESRVQVKAAANHTQELRDEIHRLRAVIADNKEITKGGK